MYWQTKCTERAKSPISIVFCSTGPSLLWHLQISGVVYMFRFPPQTALAVGLSMAQIGEFAFVLLSVASQLGLMPYQIYMLLMGAPLCPCMLLRSMHATCFFLSI